jgi:DNA-binding transcriptional LysR family regulator
VNLNQLRFVRAVAETGTFTAGSERCCVSQSTLSTGIARLEEDLGDRLFTRTTRSVSLTPFGRRLLPLVNQVLDAQEALQEAASSWRESDTLVARIGLCPLVDSEQIERILASFREANRGVRLVFDQLTGVAPQSALEEGRVDFILGPSESRRSRLERSRLYEDAVVYLPAGALEKAGTRGQPVRVDEISRDTFLLVPESCGLTVFTRKLFQARRLTLNQYEGRAVSYQVLEEWARLGVGSAIVPRSKLSTPEIGHPIVLANNRPAVIRFEAVWSPATNQLPHVQALARHFTNVGLPTASRSAATRGRPGQLARARQGRH